jgi:hypothetical protein
MANKKKKKSSSDKLSQVPGMKIHVKGIEWSILLVPEDLYLSKFNEKSAGITRKDIKYVYYNNRFFNLRLVRHELMHMYVSSCCGDSMLDLSLYDFEELFAGIIEDHLDDIMEQSNNIYDNFLPHHKKLLAEKVGE